MPKKRTRIPIPPESCLGTLGSLRAGPGLALDDGKARPPSPPPTPRAKVLAVCVQRQAGVKPDPLPGRDPAVMDHTGDCR